MRSGSFTKNDKVMLTGFVVLVGFFLAIVLHYILGCYAGLPYPYNTYLFNPADRMADWGGAYTFSSEFDPFHTLYRGQGNNYPPFGYLISVPFILFGKTAGGIIFGLSFCAAFFYFCWKYILDGIEPRINKFYLFIIFGLMTYPFQFAFDRMNAENAIFILMLLFFIAYKRGYTWVSAIFVGAATAAKVYPGFAVCLFLRAKKYRDAAIAVLSAATCTGLALLIFETSPQEAMDAYHRSSPGFEAPMWHSDVLQHTSSLFALIRIIQIKFLHYNQLAPDALEAKVRFTLFCFTLFVIAAVLVMGLASLLKRIAVWESFTLLVCGMLILMPVSFDYKLLYLFFPYALFLEADVNRKTAVTFSVLFGLLFIPKDYFVFFDDVTTNVVLNILILSWMFIRICLKAFSPQQPIVATAT